MTKNVDPNEAWLENIFSDIRLTCDDCDHQRCIGARTSCLQAILAKLHEAGELERELDALAELAPERGRLDIQYCYEDAFLGDWEWQISYNDFSADSPVGNGESLLQAVRTLRKKLEEEGIC